MRSIFFRRRLSPVFLFALGAALLADAAGAQEAPRDSTARRADSTRSLEQKIDRMGGKIDDIHDDVRVIRKQTVESPLGDRAWGIELNPLYLLFLSEGVTLSGSLSNFSWNRSGEFAVPFYYTRDSRDEDQGSLLNLDATYRHFLGGSQRGFYLGGFLRYQYVSYHGYEIFSEEDSELKTLNRAGLGFSLGSRIFSRSGLYWGWSIYFGRFLAGGEVDQDELPDRPSLWLEDLILDVDLLKIGFAF
jgi:hypothetical protein